jgi:hypothetical protein
MYSQDKVDRPKQDPTKTELASKGFLHASLPGDEHDEGDGEPEWELASLVVVYGEEGAVASTAGE